jgi:hypothetical protein
VACGSSAEPQQTLTAATDAPLYKTNATVLEDATHGPMLCLGGVMAMDPPRWGTVPIADWDWDAVEGERVVRDSTYGQFFVVGRYDGETFTVVEAGPPQFFETDGLEEGWSTKKPACDEPPGGWVVPARGRTTDEDAGELGAWAEGRPEYVAAWVTYLDPDVLEKVEAGEEGPFAVVFSLVVDRDAADVEAAVRERWDGPLCVVARDLPTAGVAAGIRREAEAAVEELGLVMVGSDSGEVGEAAQIWVVADPGGAGQGAMDERFGPGVIRLVPELVLVE